MIWFEGEYQKKKLFSPLMSVGFSFSVNKNPKI